MIDFVGRLGDRLLQRLVPNLTASADSSWYVTCYCIKPSGPLPAYRKRKLCHVVGGISSCSGCDYTDYPYNC